LDGVGVSHKVDNLKGVLNNPNGHELLTVVTAVVHEAVHKALNNGALVLLEATLGITTSRVRDVHFRLLDGNVIRQADIIDLNVVIGPTKKKPIFPSAVFQESDIARVAVEEPTTC